MKRSMLKKIAAVAMAGAMMASLSVPAMAEGRTSTPTTPGISIEKKLTKGEKTHTPDLTYNFTIAPAQGYQDGTKVVSDGVVNGVDTTASIATSDEAKKDMATTITVGEAFINVHPEVFTHAGIYRYTITEQNVDYDGITIASPKYMEVYIVNGKSGLEYASCVIVNEQGKETEKVGQFINDYDTNKLTVTKNVTGNQGDKSKDFEFTLTLDPAETGEQYEVEVAGKTVTGTPDEKGNINYAFTLKDTQSVVVYGLSPKDTYTITETSYAAQGYKTTIDGTEVNTKSGTISGDTNVNVTNEKEGSPATGIVMDIAPYIIMVAAAGVLAFVFLRRRSYTK